MQGTLPFAPLVLPVSVMRHTDCHGKSRGILSCFVDALAAAVFARSLSAPPSCLPHTEGKP
eukprot:598297-Rhodomonas_salina.1